MNASILIKKTLCVRVCCIWMRAPMNVHLNTQCERIHMDEIKEVDTYRYTIDEMLVITQMSVVLKMFDSKQTTTTSTKKIERTKTHKNCCKNFYVDLFTSLRSQLLFWCIAWCALFAIHNQTAPFIHTLVLLQLSHWMFPQTKQNEIRTSFLGEYGKNSHCINTAAAVNTKYQPEYLCKQWRHTYNKEKTRLRIAQKFKNWILDILPTTLILFILQCKVHKQTHTPFFTLHFHVCHHIV